MTRLALKFPCLKMRFGKAAANGLAPWNPELLIEASSAWSAKERLVVSFLLTVWDPGQTQLEAFNPVDAFRKWDREHWVEFVRWAIEPFYF
jgi:hypothetical protein